MLQYIVYNSFSKSKIKDEELAILLSRSKEWNKKNDITGILIYRFNKNFDRGNFLQIIEGPERSMLEVWDRITNDNRHHTITKLEEGTSEKRNFPDWTMGFKNLSDESLTVLAKFPEINSESFWSNISKLKPRAFQLLKSFYDQ
jgi:hypothetical protein